MTTFYVLVDYWAKIGIGKAGGPAVCEGDSVGLSAHGSMFVYRNPSRIERDEIDAKYGRIDWKLFGPASDEDDGLAYLEEHFNAFCDDAEQNNYHTKSVQEATIELFLEGRPWLCGSREARIQSDNASNYRDPTCEIDLGCVGTRCFSEAGMGKDEGDANGSVNKGHFKRKRDAGEGLESSGDLLRIAHDLGMRGQTHAKLIVDRSNEVRGVAGRDSVCRNYSLWTIDEKSITFWESLDVEASRTTMKSIGRAVGYGPGVVMTLAEFNKTQRTQMAGTGARLELADGAATAEPNPK